MRIGIDARFWGEQGHGRYLRNLVKELAAIDNENEYTIFLIKKDFDRFEIPNSRFKKVLADIRWYTLKEQLFLPGIFSRERLDLLHVPHFNVPLFYHKPIVITVHDLTITHFSSIRATTLPFFVWKLKRATYHIVVSSAVARAKKILAVSNFTKSEILKFYPKTPEDKIVVTPEAVEASFVEKGQEFARMDPGSESGMTIKRVKEKYGITKQYLLYIGNVHPHKNIDRLLRVFNDLQKDFSGNVQLVLVGKDDYFQKRLKMENGKWQMENNVVWTGFVPDKDLVPLLKGAAAFVFPSLMEGFGIPPLEAMAVGTPVISSNTSSLPEVCGDAAHYFDPKNEADMKQKIKEVLEDENLRLTLIQKGYNRVGQFSWRKMAEQTLSAYNAA